MSDGDVKVNPPEKDCGREVWWVRVVGDGPLAGLYGPFYSEVDADEFAVFTKWYLNIELSEAENKKLESFLAKKKSSDKAFEQHMEEVLKQCRSNEQEEPPVPR